jgi:hypothetical protein
MQSNTHVPIPETFDGLLSLTVCDAEVKRQDLKESFEPYLKISLGSSSLTQRLKEGETLGKERYTTQPKPQSGNHPIWNESHDFSIHKMKQDSHLKIKLFDRNVLKDEFLGLTRIDLSELVRNLSNQKQYYDLLDKNNNSIGRVGIITKFVGMDLPVQQAVKKEESTDQHIQDQGQLALALVAVVSVDAAASRSRSDHGRRGHDDRRHHRRGHHGRHGDRQGSRGYGDDYGTEYCDADYDGADVSPSHEDSGYGGDVSPSHEDSGYGGDVSPSHDDSGYGGDVSPSHEDSDYGYGGGMAAAGNANGSPCSTEGKMECSGTGFNTCANGAWIYRACADRTACRPDATAMIVCDWPQATQG